MQCLFYTLTVHSAFGKESKWGKAVLTVK